jgi:D-glycero-D-manno-heptose 1,7-bisphosphate phosphatase
MDIPKQAVILCGGLGERLRPLTDLVPKPMVLLNGVPFLRYLLRQIKDNGIKEVILLTGYRGEQIREYFKDGGQLGLLIRYSHGPVEWETGRRLFEAKDLLDEHFLLLYSDNFLSFNLKKAVEFYDEQKKILSFVVQSKEKGNIRMGEDGLVKVYDKTRTAQGLSFVELGYMIISKKVFEFYRDKDVSFSDIIKKLVAVGQVAGFGVLDAYYSISDIERLKLAEKYLKPKKILLIDRDGVINKKAPRGEYVGSWENFSFIPENVEGMKKLSQAGFSFIVISNQAGIARGMVTAEAVDFIHQRMREALKDKGINILDIYLCPHHWDEKCSCRKPEPGLFFEASRKWSFRLDKAYFIGDDSRDCQAAYRAGCGCVYAGDDHDLKDLSSQEQPQIVVKNLNEAVPYLEKI